MEFALGLLLLGYHSRLSLITIRVAYRLVLSCLTAYLSFYCLIALADSAVFDLCSCCLYCALLVYTCPIRYVWLHR